MTTSRATWPRLERLFHEAVQLDPEACRTFLERNCPVGDPARDPLDQLLSADRSVTDTWSSLSLPPPEPGPPIPGYRDLTLLGQGGMGTVYRGHRHDDLFDGKAFAIKVLHHHRTDAGGLRRFDMERRLLADLNHPSIVNLHDAGKLSDGRPYLVMDYVDGRPLDLHCNEERLSIDGRLALFRDVCKALHHAHQHQVIHRDLKPSNIMVDQAGVPHLLDFGIAKRLNARDESTEVTSWGHGPMTVVYASPEQVLGQHVTTASDLYALGVILCELLTNHRPAPPEPHARATPAPPAPSQLVLETDTQATDVRRTTVGRLKRRLRGDLDHIAHKALRTDPAARYASARELADDVARHLAGQPVLARRGGWRYVASRFAWRHRARFAVAASLLLVVALAATTAMQSKRRVAAEQAAAEKDQLVRTMAGPASDTLLVEGRLDQTLRETLELDLSIASKATLIDAMRRLRIPDDVLFQRLPDLLKPGAVAGATHGPLAEKALHLGRLFFHRNHFQLAEAVLLQAALLSQSAFGANHVSLAPPLELRGRALAELERFDEASATLLTAIQLRKAAARPKGLAQSIMYLSGVRHRQGAFVESVALAHRGLEVLAREVGEHRSLRGILLSSLAVAQIELDEFDAERTAEDAAREALELHTAAHGPGHLQTIQSRHNLATILGRTGQVVLSLKVGEVNLDWAETTLGEHHPRLAFILTGLAAGYSAIDRTEDCVAHARRAVDLRKSQLPPGDWLTAFSQTRLALCLCDMGQNDEALDLFHASIQAFERSHVADGKWLELAREYRDQLVAAHSDQS